MSSAAVVIGALRVKMQQISNRDNFHNFLFAVLNVATILKCSLPQKERICTKGSTFFPKRIDPFEEGGKNANGSCFPSR